jgi:hypothetical protein
MQPLLIILIIAIVIGVGYYLHKRNTPSKKWAIYKDPWYPYKLNKMYYKSANDQYSLDQAKVYAQNHGFDIVSYNPACPNAQVDKDGAHKDQCFYIYGEQAKIDPQNPGSAAAGWTSYALNK